MEIRQVLEAHPSCNLRDAELAARPRKQERLVEAQVVAIASRYQAEPSCKGARERLSIELSDICKLSHVQMSVKVMLERLLRLEHHDFCS